MNTYKWDDTTFEQRQILSKLNESGDPNNIIPKTAAILGTQTENLLRYIRHHNAAYQNIISVRTERQVRLAAVLDPILSKVLQEPILDPILEMTTASRLSNIDHRWREPIEDEVRWLQQLQHLRDSVGVITVMHLCDWHEPYANAMAKELSYQLVEYVKPNVVVVGSDFADFALISRFGSDPDHGDYDELDVLQEVWNKHIKRLHSIVPDALVVYVEGNHEYRIRRFLVENAPSMRKRVMRDYENIIRANGAVFFLGHKEDVRIGPLLVMHGNVTNKYPAAALLQDVGCQVSVMAGHVHRLDEKVFEGEDFTVKAVTSGCVEDLPEHWKHGRRSRNKPHYGTAIAQVNLKGREVWFDNLKFEGKDNFLSVRYERRVFTSFKTG